VARIQLWNGDICDLEVDAIVSPASVTLWMSVGVGAAVKHRGGDAIEIAAIRQGPVALGDAIVTPAGRLAARHVIHAVTIDRGRRTSREAIGTAARNAIARARELDLQSVAIPALGTGVGGFPIEEAAAATVEAVRDELDRSPSIDTVIFALQGREAYAAFRDALAPTVDDAATTPASAAADDGGPA
jgi:O-acetyl-ADP-ribose deacetylase (regulator of RNase III)